MANEFKSLSEKIETNPFLGASCRCKDIKEFIERICNRMNCGWRVDVILELAGDKLINNTKEVNENGKN